jgi:hypothetical protein
MIAAAQPPAVRVGVTILQRGGSAVDAAIAVNACLTAMEPSACGLAAICSRWCGIPWRAGTVAEALLP